MYMRERERERERFMEQRQNLLLNFVCPEYMLKK